MGEADEPPLLTDGIHSWAEKQPANGNSLPGPRDPSPHHDLNASLASPHQLSEKHASADGVPADGSATSHSSPIAAQSSAAPPAKTEQDNGRPSSITSSKQSWSRRAKAGSRRFVNHSKDAITHSWINVLLIFVPIGIAVNWAPLGHSKPTIVFALNAVAIIPLAALLSHATESVASRMGDTLASLLNVTFGNAVELIIFILALAKDQISIVQASILGSILANLLLILGMSFLLGGLRFREQIYNSTVTQMSSVLLSLSVTSLLLPTAFHASFRNNDDADLQTTKISRGTSIVLLFVYMLYLLFQLKSHAYMYESTPQKVIDEESRPGVFAEMMNSSSSDDSSSSDSDSDTSDGSHRTAKSRFKRAFRNRIRRRSNASSLTAQSSVISSPFTDAKGVQAGSITWSTTHPRRRDTEHSTAVGTEEGDADDEHDRHISIVDLEGRDEQPSKRSKRSKRHRFRKSKDRKNKETQPSRPSLTSASQSQPSLHAESTTAEPTAVEPSQATRRPFAIARPSFRAPIPNPFAHTVFGTPQDPQTPSQPMPGAYSIARGLQLRRTTSLPDRLNHTPKAGWDQDHSTGMVLNSADALRHDKPKDTEKSMSRTAAVVLLLVSTGLVAFCAELLVDAIPEMVESTSVSPAFIGLIVLPIVGNAAEHVTAVTVAMKNKMDLAIGIAVGSSIQIALFITPLVVLLGWIMGKDMSLYFNLFETVSLFVTAFVVNFLVMDGRSNYLEGSLLIAAYVIIALVAFYYPTTEDQSLLGGA